MSSPLYRIIQWVEENGPYMAKERLSLALGRHCVREGVVFRRIGPATVVSPEFMQAARSAASKIVGKKCFIA